jgi:glycosyltransferase involved in cell wall biosynthesis
LVDTSRSLPPQNRELAERELDLFVEVSRKTHPDHVVHLYADPVIRRLVRRPALSIPVTLCIFFPRAHYPTSYASPLMPRELLRARFLEYLVGLWRRRPDAHALFALDEEAVRGWSARSGVAPYWLPEPPIVSPSIDFAAEREGCVLYGTLAARKGVDLVARAIAFAPCNVKIILGGDVEPDFRLPLSEYVAAMEETGATIEIHPRRHSEEQGLRLLAGSRCVLLPYLNKYGMSRVLLEAATVRTPVIAHRTGLVGHLVRRHGLGMTVDCTDPLALREAMLQMSERTISASLEEALERFAALYAADRFRERVLAPFVPLATTPPVRDPQRAVNRGSR